MTDKLRAGFNLIGNVLALLLVLASFTWWVGGLAAGGTISTGMYPYECKPGMWQATCESVNDNRTGVGSVIVGILAFTLPVVVFFAGAIPAGLLLQKVYDAHGSDWRTWARVPWIVLLVISVLVWPVTMVVSIVVSLMVSTIGAFLSWADNFGFAAEEFIRQLEHRR